MKKYILTSLLVFVPFMATAADHCTNPGEYTVDRRCYVTAAQKTQKPYSAVVMLPGKNGNNICTGTIVRENGSYYVYTARHCVRYDNWSGDSYYTYTDPVVDIKLQDNRTLQVSEYKISTDEYQDLAVYRFRNNNDVIAVKDIAIEKTDNKGGKGALYDGVRLVGYDKLKIMSDKDIEDFKADYIGFLKRKGISKSEDEDGGVDVSTRGIQEMIQEPEFSQRWAGLITDNDKLKVSVCDYYADYGADGCQGWDGNSGAPYFDTSDKIMAVQSGGKHIIGGDNHARVGGGKPDTEYAGTTSLLKGATEK